MESSVPYVVAVLIVRAVAFGLTMIMRSVNRNRSRGGMMLAAMMLLNMNWAEPPPKHETENLTPRRKTGGDRDLAP